MLVAFKLWAALSSPLGRLALIGLAFFAWTAYQRSDARSDCQTEQLEAQLEAAEQQVVEANRLRQEAEDRAAEREAEIVELQERANDLTFDLPDVDACVLPDDVLDRLRAIR